MADRKRKNRTARGAETSPRWLTANDVAARYACSRVQVYRMVKAGLIPAPVSFGPRISRWDAEALDAADAARVAA